MAIQSRIKKLIKREKPKPKKRMKPKPKSVEPVHQHLWKIIGKTYAPPSNLQMSPGGDLNIPEEALERLAFGVTTLLWECSCGETRREELLGSDEDLLESLIDKADKLGPQLIERRGNTYIISEWKPQNQNPEKIPVR